jgi:ubiquitin carboxyl-terminal hydrolase 9/13
MVPQQAPSTNATKDAVAKKKEEPSSEVTPLEKMLLNAGPLKMDGSDRFYGFENVSPLILGECTSRAYDSH